MTVVLALAALALQACSEHQPLADADEYPAWVEAEFSAQARDGGWWWASNAEYAATNAGEPPEYAMRYWRDARWGVVHGCMWGRYEDRVEGPYWRFLSIYDPRDGGIHAYQSSPAGPYAVGKQHPHEDGATEIIQTLHSPGVPASEIRHLGTTPHPDTMVTRSFDRIGDDWTPRREYTWIWVSSTEEPPC